MSITVKTKKPAALLSPVEPGTPLQRVESVHGLVRGGSPTWADEADHEQAVHAMWISDPAIPSSKQVADAFPGATTAAPATLSELLGQCRAEGFTLETLSGILKRNHFWPALQVKRFFDRSGLALLHNTYKRVDVDGFRGLYEECRSVVIDLNAAEGEEIVVALAQPIPERMSVEAYARVLDADGDICEESFDGTVVHVYFHNGKAYFGTSGCPTIDSSRYHHPTKTHGDMLNEALSKVFPDAKDPREAFAATLDPARAYAFLLVHHQNTHTTDYSGNEAFGPEYAKLVYLWSRAKGSTEAPDRSRQPGLPDAILSCRRYASPMEAIEAVRALPERQAYGFLVFRRDGTQVKVSAESIVQKEEHDLGNSNPWCNLLGVFLQNRPDFGVSDYIALYKPQLPEILIGGVPISPQDLIETAVLGVRDLLYRYYLDTTEYFPRHHRFRMNMARDKAMDRMLRFHLAQMRHLQVSSHTHAILTKEAVFHYLCFHQTMKNNRLLIQHLSENADRHAAIPARTAECIRALHNVL